MVKSGNRFFYLTESKKELKEAYHSVPLLFSSSSILIDFSALMTRVCYGAVTAPCTWARENPRFVRDAMAPFDI
jgi:hypothetical protein